MHKNIVLKIKCSLVIQNFMVSMAIHYATLKNRGIRTKYSYLNSNSSKITEVIAGQSSLI